MENLFLGREQEFKKYGLIDFKAMAEASTAQLAKVGLDIDPTIETSKLSFSQRQLIELAKVLTLEERISGDLVILLDEPTSVLSEDEVGLLFELVNKLKERAAFIFVSHRLDEVISLSDRIYVLKDGEVVDEVDGKKAEASKIQARMVGRESIRNIIVKMSGCLLMKVRLCCLFKTSQFRVNLKISALTFMPARSCVL